MAYYFQEDKKICILGYGVSNIKETSSFYIVDQVVSVLSPAEFPIQYVEN